MTVRQAAVALRAAQRALDATSLMEGDVREKLRAERDAATTQLDELLLREVPTAEYVQDAIATLRRHGSVHRPGTNDRVAYDREADAVEALANGERSDVDIDGDRRDFLDLLDMVEANLVSEQQALVDLPPGCDRRMFAAVRARIVTARRFGFAEAQTGASAAALSTSPGVSASVARLRELANHEETVALGRQESWNDGPDPALSRAFTLRNAADDLLAQHPDARALLMRVAEEVREETMNASDHGALHASEYRARWLARVGLADIVNRALGGSK